MLLKNDIKFCQLLRLQMDLMCVKRLTGSGLKNGEIKIKRRGVGKRFKVSTERNHDQTPYK